MPDDQESTILTEEAAQEKDPEKLLEIILSLAAAINEQQSQGGNSGFHCSGCLKAKQNTMIRSQLCQSSGGFSIPHTLPG
jgi:hypothetical protein